MHRQKLLIIDDSPDIHELVQVWLTDEPVDFVSCYTGQEALQSVLCLRPDLILLDVDLPGYDGFEVCRQLKANATTADIPVVFLTGASSSEEKLKGLELGATDYIIKPFDPPELRARVRSSLNTRRLMDLLAQKATILQESEERFRLLAENSSDIISRHRPDGAYLYVSPAATTILGYSPAEMVGRPLMEFVHQEDIETVVACYTMLRVSGNTGTVSFRFRRRDGEYVWLESTGRTLSSQVGAEIREIQASARDVSARKQMEFREQARAEVMEMIAQGRPLNEILRALIDIAERQEPRASAAGVMLSEGVLHHCAPNLPPTIALSIERQLYSLINRFGVLAAESKDQVVVCDLLNDPAWASLHAAVREQNLRSCWSVLIRSRHGGASGIFSLYRRDNQQPPPSAVKLLQLAADLASVAIQHHELTDQLTFQAQHDGMTQLPNRALFTDRLGQALAASARTKRPAAVLLIDVDRFKHINDTYGHHAGDEVLCQVAHRLSSRLRACDTLARMGGDEFAVILSDLANPDDAHAVAKSLNDELKEPIDLNGRRQFVTISIGSAVYPRDATEPMPLLKNADLALYSAKDAGRNTARLFTSDMGQGAVEHMELECALRQAVEKGELRLVYQPKVDSKSRIVGLEALVRWEHPTLGTVPPIKFISLAEDTGVINAIGSWVLGEAARQARAWVAAGYRLVPIAVNVSTMQFGHADFVRTIARTLETCGLSQRWLEIELTESLLMRNIRDGGEKLAQLREMQVSVAIDDFGTGYSSLAYLQQLSLDTLKIDHSFVCTIDSIGDGHHHGRRNEKSGRTIIGAIVALAKSLGLQVIAEGVETETQREFLVGIGCDLLQGYLFCRPAPADKIELLLQKQIDVSALPLARSA